ncbi:MAG: 4-(cytidine 5'-diphospho)-2-C-methyl-D-erythritol kinase [Clostridia bacterium]|nr:4-(cytidine 5'-diphospho)-2-C-methyl-D-erythritol kinase [Clostridia bacterium]
MEKIKLRANAKINLCLAINGKRQDGYHLIDTVMQSVDIFDDVTIEKDDNISVVCDIDVPMEKNIAYKAAMLFFEETEIIGGSRITINKNIPEAAGLGGGSADAAAVLLGLNTLYETNLSYEILCNLAEQLGADVPFFIKGGTQRCEGIGEILTELPLFDKGYFLIVKHGEKPSTKEMYNKLDKVGYNNPDTKSVIEAVEKGDFEALAENLGNCFADTQDFSFIEAKLVKTNPLGVCLSGSGPSVFAMYESKEKANKAKEYFDSLGIKAYLAKSCKCAIETE